MSQAQLQLELALSTRPTEAPEWVDVTEYLRGPIAVRRGRQHDLGRFDVGRLDFVLDNADRRFDPSYVRTLVNMLSNPAFGGGDSGGIGTNWTIVLSNAELAGKYTPTVEAPGLNGSGYMQRITIPTLSGLTATRYLYLRSEIIPVDRLDMVYRAYVCLSTLAGTPRVRLAPRLYYDSGGSPVYSWADNDSWISAAGEQQIEFFGTSTWDQDYVQFQVQIELKNGDAITLDVSQCQAIYATVSEYGDGSLPGHHWDGTPHASESYSGGPYYGQLKPMRRARLSALWGGALHRLITGYVESWPPRFPVGNNHVPVTAKDGFAVIAAKTLNGSYPEELSGARVNRVLDAVGWTTGTSWVLDSATNSQLDSTTVLSPTEGDRAVMGGQTTVQAETLEEANALDHLHEVALAENGLLFVAKGGALAFHERHYRLKPVNTTSKATFGDDLSEMPFVDFELAYDDRDLYNEIRCTRQGGTTQTAEDATSKLEYFERTLTEDGLLAATDAEMADRANWLLSRRKDPAWRVESITLDPEGDDALWPVVLGLELGDRITVNRRPDGGDLIGGDYHVEHIAWNISATFRWRVTLRLSPADPTTYWHVSDGSDEYAPYAVLGVTTVLAY